MKNTTNKSRPTNLSTRKVHDHWKTVFLSDRNWADISEHLFVVKMRRLGLSGQCRNRKKQLSKLESKLTIISKSIGLKIEIDKEAQYKICGQPVEDALISVFRTIRSEIKFLDYLHRNRTRGPGRIIPSFIAKHVLVGFALHDGDKEGQYLMREFLSDEQGKSQSGFYQWCKKSDPTEEFGLEEIANTICGSRSATSDPNQWAKATRLYFLDVLEFAGERKAGKRDPKRRAKLSKEVTVAANRLRSVLEN